MVKFQAGIARARIENQTRRVTDLEFLVPLRERFSGRGIIEANPGAGRPLQCGAQREPIGEPRARH